jgi:plastocyanin
MIPAGALGGAGEASTHAVTLKNIRFHPGTLTIRRGDSVTWLWREHTLHNVTFAHSHSRTQASGSYTLRFSRTGTFAYFCSIHVALGMRGRIIVR